MATRFYFDATSAAAVSPAYGAGWASTVAAVRRRLNLTKQSSAMAGFTGTALAPNNTDTILVAQFVAPDLSAQTISGSISGQVRCIASSLNLNGFLAVRVAKCASDGSGVVEICAISASDLPANRFAVAATNRRMRDAAESASIALSSVGVSAGDCLIVEIGFVESSTLVRTGTLYFGDDSGTDLPQDDSDTNAFNPWIEFSGNIAFGGAGNRRRRAIICGGGVA